MSKRPSPAAERMAAGGYYQPTEPPSGQSFSTPKPQEAQTPKRVKKTVYLQPEVDLLVTQLQLEEQRRTGVRPDRSDLMEEGIRLLYQQRQDAETS